VIPVFNEDEAFRAALASARGQTLRDSEIIVVDDGSDRPLALTADEAADTRVRLVRHAENRGTAAARNTGIREARAPLIAFLDADDTWSPEKLERQRDAYAKSCTGGDDLEPAIVTGYTLVRPGGEIRTIIPPANRSYGFGDMLWGWGLSPGSTLLVARKAFDRVGLFDTDLRRLEDWDWLIRFTASGRVISLGAPLATVRNMRPPPNDAVARALERIEKKHGPALRETSFRLHARFRSTLFLERAAMHYRDGRVAPAMKYVLFCIMFAPVRNLTFYRGIIVNFLGALAGKKRPT